MLWVFWGVLGVTVRCRSVEGFGCFGCLGVFWVFWFFGVFWAFWVFRGFVFRVRSAFFEYVQKP